MEALGSRLQSLQVGLPALTPIPRPGFGTRGTPFAVQVNTFKVPLPEITCYHYDIKIGNGDNPAKLNREVWKALAGAPHYAFGDIPVAYDGKSMAYSPTRLPADRGEWTVQLPEDDGGPARGRGNAFQVRIAFIRPIDLSQLSVFVRGGHVEPSDVLSAIQALNVAIQHGPMLRFPSRGSSFFLPPSNAQAARLSRGVKMWRGYYTSLRLGIGHVFVNVDLSSCPMVTAGNLPDLIMAYGASRDGPGSIPNMRPDIAIQLSRLLKGLRVSLTVPDIANNRVPHRRIAEYLPKRSASSITFEDENGKQTNMTQYFLAHYGVRLVHPEWPVIRVSKIALWPIELVVVKPGQKFNHKLDGNQTAEALKLTTVGPSQRPRLLTQGVETISPNNKTALQQWGISIDSAPMETIARLLPPPRLSYQKPVAARDGVWDVRGNTFFKPSRIERWVAFVFDNPRFFTEQDAQRAMSNLNTSCGQLGVYVANSRPPIIFVPQGCRDIPGFIKTEGPKVVKGGPPDLLVCFLARKPSPEYGIIKRFGDCEIGVASQCLSIPKVKKANPAYWSNVVLKINVKLGGTNSVIVKDDVGPFSSETIVFGADVTHPAPGSLAPSIAAVVASLDRQITTYGSQFSIQNSRQEIIHDLADMVQTLLRRHGKALGPPKKIIFFRDGVSEGQFDAVLQHEANAIRLACQRIDPKYKPAITYIVCGKRHHMSFFPVNPRDGDPKNGNVKAGTTVDRDITSPFQFDFYIQSHASLLGTGRSAHYTVLMDDSKFSADTLQQLVYNICYTYARCTRSVSYATPAYYADRLAERAATILRAGGFDMDTAMIASSHSGDSLENMRMQKLAEFRAQAKAFHVNHNANLFFM
ncbi:Piwi-domain-containing protein [Meredithblackwellia eburnea MCA 4105]